MVDTTTISRAAKITAIIIFVFWWLIVLGDATQVPFTFPIGVDNVVQFLILLISVILVAIASLIDEANVDV